MPLTDRSKAKDSGFAQVRAALVKFKGDITRAEFGQWGGKLVDEEGKPIPPREFLEVECSNVEVLEVTEELSMPVDEWNFRVNSSDYKGSFWVEKFLESADRFKVLIPEGLLNKRITWERVTLEAFDRAGNPTPKFNSTNYVIAGIEEIPVTTAKPAPKVVASAQAQPVQAQAPTQAPALDLMEEAKKLAVGKTEQQFRTAIGLDPKFSGNPLLPLAKAGAVTTALVNDGKLVKVKQGTKEVYQLPS